MKNLFWTKIPVTSITETIWKDITNEQDLLKQTVDTDEFSALFGKNAPATSAAPSTAVAKSAAPTNISVLDSNRAIWK